MEISDASMFQKVLRILDTSSKEALGLHAFLLISSSALAIDESSMEPLLTQERKKEEDSEWDWGDIYFTSLAGLKPAA